MTVSRSATSGNSRGPDVACCKCSAGPAAPPWMRCLCGGGGRPLRGASPLIGLRFGRGGHPLVVQGLQDPGPEALLELEQDPDARQVDAEVLGQMPDPE